MKVSNLRSDDPRYGRRADDKPRTAASAAAGRHRLILIITGVLFVFGLVMVTSASSSIGVLDGGHPYSYLEHQLIFGVIGLIGMFVAMRVQIDLVRRLARPGLIVSGVLLALVFVPGLNYTANGATRWLDLGPVQIQPSELVKLACVIYLAHYLSSHAPPTHWLFGFIWRRDGVWYRPLTWLEPGGRALFLAMVIFFQHDLGTAMVTSAGILVLFLLSGTRARVMLRTVVPAFLLVIVSIAAEPYRRQRFFAFLDPQAHAHDSGYQLMQGLIAIGSGGPFGRGLGHSVEKVFYLPEAHTDMIYSVIGEELGVIGIAVVLVGFAALAVVGMQIAMHARNRFAALLAAGLTVTLCGQALLNVCGVVGLLPLTGVPLPLVSYGGSSLIVTFFSLGLLANIAVFDARDSEPENAGQQHAAAGSRTHRRGRNDGAHRAGTRSRKLPAR